MVLVDALDADDEEVEGALVDDVSQFGVEVGRAATESAVVAISLFVESDFDDFSELVEEDERRMTFSASSGRRSELRRQHQLALALDDRSVGREVHARRQDLKIMKEMISFRLRKYICLSSKIIFK